MIIIIIVFPPLTDLTPGLSVSGPSGGCVSVHITTHMKVGGVSLQVIRC